MKPTDTILITGAHGMLGTHLVSLLRTQGFLHLLQPTSRDLDLRCQSNVDSYFSSNVIDYVFHLAARVGGIKANMSAPSDFLVDNLQMQTVVFETARKYHVKKLLFVGSSCIYPRMCSQPMSEDQLLTGTLEPTNEGYALAKITGLKACEYSNKQHGTNFICLMPPNLYGPHDHFDLERSHVISALIHKFVAARTTNTPSVEVWGTGNARREFLYAGDFADAMFYFMQNYDAKDIPPFVNIGAGTDIRIKELAELIKTETGYQGELRFDTTKPDGMPQKLLNVTLADKLGWHAKTSLRSGIQKTISWYQTTSLKT